MKCSGLCFLKKNKGPKRPVIFFTNIVYTCNFYFIFFLHTTDSGVYAFDMSEPPSKKRKTILDFFRRKEKGTSL